MTKDEIMTLLDKRIMDADEHVKIFTGNDSYFAGIQEGLRQAKELVGMLDKRNKASNDLVMPEELGKNQLDWQTGTPRRDGHYIVTYLLEDGGPFVTSMIRTGYHWYTLDGKRLPDPELVTAWFKMCDIKPYRER